MPRFAAFYCDVVVDKDLITERQSGVHVTSPHACQDFGLKGFPLATTTHARPMTGETTRE
jgi:hypothetical protein